MSAFTDSEVIVPIGKRLYYGDAANAATNLVSGTTTITPPDPELEKAEYTNDDSPNKTKQYRPALTEPGTCEANYKYQKTQFGVLETLKASRAVKYWMLVTPDNVSRTFQGYISKHIEGEMGLDAVPDMILTIQISGAVTLGTYTGS